jgi:pyruvate dehydrogenase E2 component (dihydrolipoamide acetyltransferase)
MIQEIKIPEIGENVEKGVIVGVLVSKSDAVDVDQPLVEVETDKAVVEIPSPYKGKITEVTVKSDDEVSVGQVIAKIETEQEETREAQAQMSEETEKEPEEEKEEETVRERREKDTEKEKAEEKEEEEEGEEEEEDKAEAEKEEGKAQKRKIAEQKPREGEDKKKPGIPAPASPSVRRLARELGADINDVSGSGPGGRITAENVKAHVKKIVRSSDKQERPSAQPEKELPDFSKWGEIQREQLSRVRQITAENTTYAWNVVPHVTQFDKADITQLEEFRGKYSKAVEEAGGKLTVTAVIMKVIAAALERFPRFNASLDPDQNEIIYKKYCHIAMAVDTDRGLLVPVIRDVDKKSIHELAVELTDIADRTRKKKIKPEEMEGGTFTISNQGGIGGTDFTPIVFWPQVAILGVSRSSIEPRFKDGEFEPRKILPLSLSYDHRVIDGADAARFLRWVVEALEHPLLLNLDS